MMLMSTDPSADSVELRASHSLIASRMSFDRDTAFLTAKDWSLPVPLQLPVPRLVVLLAVRDVPRSDVV